ncbi:hypothetical protein GCM10009733_107400 [Nonomuraea maheshkhaliensis]|uniref:CopG family transcriptional regulator n=1 Tax=Nonomuraea maheshkhaliensis TaxID=419590 RepID=A0ABN2HV49_9ACTN
MSGARTSVLREQAERGDRQRFWDTADDIRCTIERGEEIPGVPLAEVLAGQATRPPPPKPADEHR